jgi:hypothetical protein
MINLGDVLRPLLRFCDRTWIGLMGRHVLDLTTAKSFRAIYLLPITQGTIFGLDLSDEAVFQTDYPSYLRKFGKPPEVGSILQAEGRDWRVVSSTVLDRGGILGMSNRLSITATPYVKCRSVTKEVSLYVEDKVQLGEIG